MSTAPSRRFLGPVTQQHKISRSMKPDSMKPFSLLMEYLYEEVYIAIAVRIIVQRFGLSKELLTCSGEW